MQVAIFPDCVALAQHFDDALFYRFYSRFAFLPFSLFSFSVSFLFFLFLFLLLWLLFSFLFSSLPICSLYPFFVCNRAVDIRINLTCGTIAAMFFTARLEF